MAVQAKRHKPPALPAVLNFSEAETWLNQRRETMEKLAEDSQHNTSLGWIEELSARTGASPEFLEELDRSLNETSYTTTFEWMEWLLDCLSEFPNDYISLLRPWTLEKIFGRAYTTQESLEQKVEISCKGIICILPLWLNGAPLIEIEDSIVNFIQNNEGDNVKRITKTDKKAKHARRFALRLVPDLAFVAGCLKQVAKKNDFLDSKIDFLFNVMPTLVRQGLYSPTQSAFSKISEIKGRVQVHQAYSEISLDKTFMPSSWSETFNIVKDEVGD